MNHRNKLMTRVAVAAAAAAAMLATSAHAQLELKIMAPAGPGGGWDAAARSLQQAMTATGVAKSVQVTNVTGAGGTVGLAQFVNAAKGDGNQLMVNGITMVGAILTNKAPVNLDMVTPIARLTGDPLVIVVPASSSERRSTLPPASVTIPYTVARPRPEPSPCALVVKNGSNARAATAALMPSPVSLTDSST